MGCSASVPKQAQALDTPTAPAPAPEVSTALPTQAQGVDNPTAPAPAVPTTDTPISASGAAAVKNAGGISVKAWAAADTSTTFGRVSAGMVVLANARCTRTVLQPGAQWREDVLPHAATAEPGKQWCPVRRVGMVESGTVEVTMEDGAQQVLTAGMAFAIGPGHDVRVLGSSPAVCIDVESRLSGGLAKDAEGGGGSDAVSLLGKSFADAPDKTIRFPPGTEPPLGIACVCVLGPNAKAMRGVLQPGWTWTECVRPMLPEGMRDRTSCPARHVGFVAKGTLHLSHADGTERDVKAGECYVCEPDHDAWVVGEEAVEFYEFEST